MLIANLIRLAVISPQPQPSDNSQLVTYSVFALLVVVIVAVSAIVFWHLTSIAARRAQPSPDPLDYLG